MVRRKSTRGRHPYQFADDGRVVSLQATLRTRGYRRNYVIENIVSFNNITSTTSTTYGAFTFQLTDLSNPTAVENLWDKYRLKEIEMLFYPIANQMNTDQLGTNLLGNFYTALDFDNNATPSSIGQVERYSTCVVTLNTQPQLRHFTPRAVRPVYISGVSTGYAEGKPGDWLDLAYPNIPHYALIWALGATATAGEATYSVRVRYVFEFAATR
jgi:hypothetical protein